MAIYHIDATAGDDNGNGLMPTTAWQSLAKANAWALMPGDQCLLKCGEIWRERLRPPSDSMLFGAYGAGPQPIINGADILKTWTLEGGAIYSKDGITTEPLIVVYDEVILTRSAGAPGPNEWNWAADTIYVNVGENPDAGQLEASQRNCIRLDGRDYLDIKDIEFRLSYWWVIWLGSGSSHNHIHDCTGRLIGYFGIGANDGAGSLAQKNSIENCVLERVMAAGIMPGRRCLNWTIDSNKIFDANLALRSEASIKCWGELSGNHLIQNNRCIRAAKGEGGYGVWIDQVPNVSHSSTSETFISLLSFD